MYADLSLRQINLQHKFLQKLSVLGGIATAGVSFCNEARDAMFASVSQRSIRKIAKKVFEHLHNLGLEYHLDR